jgi:unsaturated rhamnogalacturonyl hydrolase
MKYIVTCMLLVGSFLAKAQQTNAEKMAANIMHIWKDSFALDNKPAKWTYDMGVILKGIEGLWMNTGNGTYFKYMQQQIDFFVNDKGQIKTYKPDEYNIDHINNGKVLLTLYRVTLKEKYLIAAKQLAQQLATHPRTQQGSFWHKKIYPNQVWLDGLYMAQPFYAEYAQLSGSDTAFADIANQLIWIEQHTRDAKTGLLYHAYDESKQMDWANKLTGTSPLFWARAMGWYATALVDVLDYFPANHPQQKNIVAIAQRLAKAIVAQQQSNGLWLDILHYTGAGKEKNYTETSASSQFIYFLAKGMRKGYLPSNYLPNVQKAYKNLVTNFVKIENGFTNLYGTVKVSGLGGKPYRDGSFAYYMSEPVIVNDPKGMCAFLLAANEMEILPTLSKGKGLTIALDNFFNAETKVDAFGNKKIFHYKWNEKDDGGYDFLGHIFNKNGVATSLLNETPTTKNLANVSMYMIVDPDWPKENKTPNYITDSAISAIEAFIKKGGTLILLANDSNNVEFKYFNKLANKFGIHFNEDSKMEVIGTQYDMGKINIEPNNPVFKTAKNIYIKQACTQVLKVNAKPFIQYNGHTFFSTAKYGKGTVVAISDPWVYNEYVDGRRLAAYFDNYTAANDFVLWLINETKKVK